MFTRLLVGDTPLKSNPLFSNTIAALVALLVVAFSGQSSAVVTIDHASTTLVNPIAIGQQFTVTVRLNWDGQGALQGVFSSTTFDSTKIQYVSNTTAPSSILSFVDNTDPENVVVIPGLGRFTTLIQQPGDPASVLRTVQYGAIDPVDSRAATTGTGKLIMTLTFQAIANGNTSISTLVANGDTGALGDTFVAGTTVPVTVPEPGQALLGLMALGSVAGVVAIRRRI